METEQLDIHNFDHKNELLKKRVVSDTSLRPSNKKYILDFINFCEAKGNRPATINKDLHSLWYIARHLKKDFKKCVKEDMVKVCGAIEGQKDKKGKPWAEKTKRNHVVAIKMIWRWLYNIDEKGVYPEAVKWMHTSVKKARNKLPEDLLTEDEILKLINACGNIRDKAFVSLLAESGARIGEILNIQLKHIAFEDKYGAKVVLFGKTGARKVLVISCAPTLAQLLNLHPQKNNSESLLFVTNMNHRTGNKPGYRQLTYQGAVKIIKNAAVKTGISKRKAHPHNFRHSAASRAARFLTESQMKNYFGWTGGSNMPALYVHLSGRDIDGGILKMHGIQAEDDTKIKLTIKTCNRCQFKNPPEAKYCNACGFVLDLQTAAELEDKLSDTRFVEEHVIGGNKDVKNMYAKLKEMEKKFDAYIAMKKEK